jgi:hypothetical protein
VSFTLAALMHPVHAFAQVVANPKVVQVLWNTQGTGGVTKDTESTLTTFLSDFVATIGWLQPFGVRS